VNMNSTEPHFRTSALLVIDMQDDFMSPGASAEIPGTAAVVPKVNKLLSAYRSPDPGVF
jgi:nicotinamidase-related amidase